MRAVGLTRFGGPEVLHALDLPDVDAGPGEVRIRVSAAAVNPADLVLRSGAMARFVPQMPPPPYVPGMDAAGVIDRIGDGVDSDLRVGDRVMAVVLPYGKHGGYAEHVVVPARSVVRVPAGATDVEAASLPMNALTVRVALDRLELKPGQVIAVTGAAGAIGSYAIQLARADGIRVIADAAARDEELVTRLGADIVLARGDDFAQRVRAVAPDGVDGVVDGALLNERIVPALRDGGRIVTLRNHTGDAERGITFHAIQIRDHALETARLDEIRQLAEDGLLTPRVARVLRAEAAAEAHALLEAGGVRGRLVLTF